MAKAFINVVLEWTVYLYNPFECASSDVEEAYPELQLLDSDHEGENDIEIERALFYQREVTMIQY